MTTGQLWRIVVYAVDTEVGDDGVTTAAEPAASWCATAMTPQDAVMAWGDQLAAEEAS